MVDWYSDMANEANVGALRQDIRDAVAWLIDEYRDIDEPLRPDLVVRLVVNAVRAINMSYTDGIVLAELELLTSEFLDVFDTLTDGAFSLTILKKGW